MGAAAIPLNWRTIEESEGEYRWDLLDQQVDWCEQNRLMVLGSPLVDFGPSGLPPWLARWEHDFFNLQSFVCDFVETAVARYMGRIRLWEIAARANTGGALALTALEEGLATREPVPINISFANPMFDSVRQSPRFDAVIRGYGLDPASFVRRKP